MGNGSDPNCITLQIADNIHCDQATKKWSIQGIFDRLGASKFPTNVKIGTYFELTAVRDSCDLKLRIVRASAELNDDEIIVEVGMTVTCKDPLEEIRGSADLIGPIERTGVYFIQMVFGENVLKERRFTVVQTT